MAYAVAADVELVRPLHDALALRGALDVVEPAPAPACHSSHAWLSAHARLRAWWGWGYHVISNLAEVMQNMRRRMRSLQASSTTMGWEQGGAAAAPDDAPREGLAAGAARGLVLPSRRRAAALAALPARPAGRARLPRRAARAARRRRRRRRSKAGGRARVGTPGAGPGCGLAQALQRQQQRLGAGGVARAGGRRGVQLIVHSARRAALDLRRALTVSARRYV